MEYHEIGEKFEYKGVMLEVVENFVVDKCKLCFLSWHCKLPCIMCCREDCRKDGKSIYYRYIGHCNPKDMEQENN